MQRRHTKWLGLTCVAMQPVMCLQMVMKRQRSNYRRSSSGHSYSTKSDDVGTGLQSQESSMSRIWSGLEHRGSAGEEGGETTGSFTSRQSSLSGRQSSLSSRGSLTRTAPLAGESTELPCCG